MGYDLLELKSLGKIEKAYQALAFKCQFPKNFISVQNVPPFPKPINLMHSSWLCQKRLKSYNLFVDFKNFFSKLCC